MIIQKNKTINGREFIETMSDDGRYVVRDGVQYSIALDPVGSERVYIEGEVIEWMDETEEKIHALEILLGVSE